jgi:hypothetical protein
VKRVHTAVLLVGAVVAAVLALGATAATPPLTDSSNEFRPRYVANHQVQIPGNQSSAHLSADHVPRPAANGLASSNTDLVLSLAGLNFEEQRTADGGNQFSLEPPDQALCVGNGFALESVNTVFRIRSSATGAPVSGVMALNPFFTQDHAFTRPAGPFGEDLGDPKCYYDPALDRFFLVVLHLGVVPATGALNNTAFFNIAVSKSGTPSTDRNQWHFYQLDVTNDGTDGTPSHPDCPCFGDQPLIGADKYGFYVTTNEFDLEPFGGSFNGAQIYAFDKAGLANGTMKVQRIEGAPLDSSYTTATDIPYSLQPASSPSAGDWVDGTEYLLGALEFSKGNVTLDNRIAVWALTNTASLATATPDVHVDDVVVTTQPYGFPPDAVQQDGPTPLADNALAAAGVVKPGNGPDEHESLIAGNDDRMEDAVWANGRLWGALNTIVKTQNGSSQVGAAYFAFTPTVSSGQVSAIVAKQGYVTVNNASVLYPAIAINNAGQGAIVFTVTGKEYFPSAGYARLTLSGGAGPVHIAELGAKPADGFSGYRAFGGSGTERWGDYSDAVVNPVDGSLWLATEWIQGNVGFPPRLANWNTRILKITP